MKHIILLFVRKSLTGNVNVVHIFIRLVRGVSYSQAEETDVVLFLQQRTQSLGQYAAPSNIHAGVFTILAGDSTDRLQETVSGSSTFHRVDGFVIHPQVKDHYSLFRDKQGKYRSPPLLLPMMQSLEGLLMSFEALHEEVKLFGLEVCWATQWMKQSSLIPRVARTSRS